MTITTIQGAPAEEEEESFFLHQACDGRKWCDYICSNQATYRCETKCCKSIVWWCEECLFAWIEWSTEEEIDETTATCMFCLERIMVTPDFIRVIGRIR
jgi:hypothetical protein